MNSQPPQHWVVDRFENGSAVLKNKNGEVIVSRSQLPPKTKEGDILTAEFYHVTDEPRRRENLARALLEEILGKE